MFCKSCGQPIDDDSVFCKHCGKSATGEIKQTKIISVAVVYSGGSGSYFGVTSGNKEIIDDIYALLTSKFPKFATVAQRKHEAELYIINDNKPFSYLGASTWRTSLRNATVNYLLENGFRQSPREYHYEKEVPV
jgi:hypothetical protein